jgi:hypothetical protein
VLSPSPQRGGQVVKDDELLPVRAARRRPDVDDQRLLQKSDAMCDLLDKGVLAKIAW